MINKEKIAKSNHKEFDNKKDAIAFLKKNALMSVGWPEGNKKKVAIYWNGRLHVENAETKKIWGSTSEGEIANRLAEEITAEDARRKPFIGVSKKIEALRQKYEPVSDEAIFLGMARDMAVHISRGNWSRVKQLGADMQSEIEE